jgi:hypothetical protein
MKVPFTLSQFLKVFEDYNLSVYPMQIIFYLLAAIIILLALRKTFFSDKVITIVVSFFWLWMGVVYHFIHFTTINNAAFVFGAVFIVEALLLLNAGVLKRHLSFKFQRDIFGITGAACILYALIVYPTLNYMAGHTYPASPTFGLPCPTTIFTFGVLMWTDKKIPFNLLLIPLIWSIIGFSAAFSLGMIEDTGLIVSGLIGCTMVIIKNRQMRLLTN